MLLAKGFYPNPVPGYIFTAIVCGICIAVAVFIALYNFGPAAKRRAASEAWKLAHEASGSGPGAASPRS